MHLSPTPPGRYDANLETALADLARDEIARRFGDQHPQIGEGSEVATFTCPSGSLGDVVVELHGAGVVVGVTGMWHGHFDQGTPEEIVEECGGFLDDLFSDRVVIWVLSGKGGGLFYPGLAVGSVRNGFLLRGGGPPPGSRAGTWSGPWFDDGPVACG